MNYSRVELKGAEWFSHYVAVAYGVLSAAASGHQAWLRPEDRPAFLYVALFATAFASVSFWWQWTALRYRRFRTTRTAQDNYLAVHSLANNDGWDFTKRERFTYIQGCLAPEFGGYARRVTVLFDGPDVYVNSIMNPARFFSPGLFSWGGITRDITAVAAAVEAPAQGS